MNYWRRNPDKEKLAQLEEEYWDEPLFLQKKILEEINALRRKLNLLQVDSNLNPIEEETRIAAPEPSVESSNVEETESVDSHREKLLDQIFELQSDLQLTDNTLKNRIKEYLKITPHWDPNTALEECSNQQLQQLSVDLEDELAKVLASRELAAKYRGGARPGFRTRDLVGLRCELCGKSFPTEMPPRPVDTPGTYHGWLPDEVPWIHGGLMLMYDAKGIVHVFHGYEHTGCYRIYARNLEEEET